MFWPFSTTTLISFLARFFWQPGPPEEQVGAVVPSPDAGFVSAATSTTAASYLRELRLTYMWPIWAPVSTIYHCPLCSFLALLLVASWFAGPRWGKLWNVLFLPRPGKLFREPWRLWTFPLVPTYAVNPSWPPAEEDGGALLPFAAGDGVNSIGQSDARFMGLSASVVAMANDTVTARGVFPSFGSGHTEEEIMGPKNNNNNNNNNNNLQGAEKSFQDNVQKDDNSRPLASSSVVVTSSSPQRAQHRMDIVTEDDHGPSSSSSAPPPFVEELGQGPENDGQGGKARLACVMFDLWLLANRLDAEGSPMVGSLFGDHSASYIDFSMSSTFDLLCVLLVSLPLAAIAVSVVFLPSSSKSWFPVSFGVGFAAVWGVLDAVAYCRCR